MIRSAVERGCGDDSWGEGRLRREKKPISKGYRRYLVCGAGVQNLKVLTHRG